MRLNCRGEGCSASLEVGDAVLPFATYTCKNHVGRKSENKTRFQEIQFDPRIGEGVDPRGYESGRGPNIRGRKSSESPEGRQASKENRERAGEKIKAVLKGHENSDKILKILNEDSRGANSGVTKVDE